MKVGDRVRALRETGGSRNLVNRVGTVIIKSCYDPNGVTVRFDDWENGWCETNSNIRNTWNCHTGSLELIPEVEFYPGSAIKIPVSSELKDSGERRTFETGAVRDRAAGKSKPILNPPWATLALGWIMEAGSRKYAARNWEKGMPLGEYIDSAQRHLEDYKLGKRDEPHLWQALWNISCAVHTQVLIYLGVYPHEFYDIPNHISKDPIPVMGEFERMRVDKLVGEEWKNSGTKSVSSSQ